MRPPSPATRCVMVLTAAVASLTGPPAAHAQPLSNFVPVTDAVLQDPAPGDWLMWRRTLDSWGYSPLDQIDRDNVEAIQIVWTRALGPGLQQGTPLVYNGVLYMPNPRDVIQAIDAVTGDLPWEYRRDRPDDLGEYLIASLIDTNRNLAIHGGLIIDTTTDDHVIALDATTGRLVWEMEILDYKKNPANQTSGPIIANGKVISGRSCTPRGGPNACVVTAHDATTGAELWRRRLIPGPGEPGDESWGGVPFEERKHVGAWMVPSYDPALNLVYVGTSVTSPAPKFLIGGIDNKHLYHSSTLALDADTFTREGEEVLVCPTFVTGGKAWEAGAYSPLTNLMYYPLRNACARMLATTEGGVTLYALAQRAEIAPGTDQVGTVQAISAETGEIAWTYEQRAGTTSLVATGGGLVFGGDGNGRFRALDHESGAVLWEINIGSSVTGFPITYAVDGRQYVAVSTGSSMSSRDNMRLTPELRPTTANNLFVFALP